MKHLHDAVREYYERKLREHGATPSGVDWNSLASQQLRFEQLAVLWKDASRATLLDYGCGYGAMLAWVRAQGFAGPYVGFDLSPAMIRAAEQQAATQTGWTFTSNRDRLPAVDFAVASGIFNVKMNTPADQWYEYILTTIDELARLGTRGFAFNALTAYSDREKQRPDLYYADPLQLFDYCKRKHSRAVALLHDYPLYEFTLIVRRS